MKYASLLLCLLLIPTAARPAGAQTPGGERSAKKAFALSLLVPGLGHRYVHHGDWDGAASAFVLAEAGLWLGLVATEVRRGQIVSDYETFAAGHADAQVAGKDRQFFLNLATYRSSDEYLDIQLRNRAWDQIDYVSERTNQWRWETESAFLQFRGMREDAETLRRRRTLAVGLLVANRLVSAFTALGAANRANDAANDLAFSLAPSPEGRSPMLHLQMRF